MEIQNRKYTKAYLKNDVAGETITYIQNKVTNKENIIAKKYITDIKWSPHTLRSQIFKWGEIGGVLLYVQKMMDAGIEENSDEIVILLNMLEKEILQKANKIAYQFEFVS